MRFRAPRRAALGLALPILAAGLAACGGPAQRSEAPGPVQGAGAVTTEDRTPDAFEHLSVGAGIRVEVTEGAVVSVTLAAQPNLLPLISTRVTDGQLVVNVASPGFSTSEPVTLTVVAPDLRSMTLSGGATGTLATTTTGTLTLDVSGGAVLVATGTAQALALTASGGAQAHLGGLEADTATVTASGGCQAELNVVIALSGDVTAGATVRLTRQPASVDVTTGGGGMVIGG
ncbi:MAG: hypothetical protein A2V85_08790 [Chloroflexi bacterium RBG_16_72_14]|nr:MAG: hypothetical protein A2V85_08790 [Chloroflexi bacterium RBG_16_72_14]